MHMTPMTYVPPRRRDAIVRPVDDEWLLIDKHTNKAHCLNQTAAQVWYLCNGTSSVADIAATLSENAESSVDAGIVWMALKQLRRAGLLTNAADVPKQPAVVTRRDALRKIAVAGAIALPLVTSIAIPTPAQAASCVHNGKPCLVNPQCCTGICRNGRCTT